MSARETGPASRIVSRTRAELRRRRSGDDPATFIVAICLCMPALTEPRGECYEGFLPISKPDLMKDRVQQFERSKFDHIGLVTTERKDGETWVEATRVWVTNPREHPYNVEFVRF